MAKKACESAGRELGWIIGESTPTSSLVLFKESVVPQVGTYVVSSSPAGKLFGVIERVSAGNRMLTDDVSSPSSVGELVQMLNANPKLALAYNRGVVRWLSRLDTLCKGLVSLPKIPPIPGSAVQEADVGLLKIVFGEPEVIEEERTSGRSRWVRVGSLIASPDVPYMIDVNKLTRHLAILAVTGGGKSNTVCVLAQRIVRDLNGTVVIFDIHGEYGDLGLGNKANVIPSPGINPLEISLDELYELTDVPPNASNQQRALREAWDNVKKAYSSNKLVYAGNGPSEVSPLIEGLLERLGQMAESKSSEGAEGAYNRVMDMIDKYGDIISDGVPRSLEDVIRPGKLNVFDLNSLDERAADAVVSHYLRRLLFERKRHKTGGRGYPVPVIVVIEEAHVLIPAKRDTLTKYWASRIAREGRKFGIGLVIVSQRPRNVDSDVLSQTNNKIILRMVEPQDIEYVQEASEELSEDLADILPSLDSGEAVVLGSMAKLPAVVKIDLCENKKGGGDIDVVGEWGKWASGGSTRSAEEVLGELI